MWAGVGALEPARLDPRPASINRHGRKFPAFFPFRALRRTGGFDFTPRAALARLPGILASAVIPPRGGIHLREASRLLPGGSGAPFVRLGHRSSGAASLLALGLPFEYSRTSLLVNCVRSRWLS